MSDNITIRLTAEEKAELERLAEAHRDASIASRRAFCAVANYERLVLERAFSELPVPQGYASEYCLMMKTLTPDGRGATHVGRYTASQRDDPMRGDADVRQCGTRLAH
jgi:hypothetical protein